jgi:hypothetical protein
MCFDDWDAIQFSKTKMNLRPWSAVLQFVSLQFFVFNVHCSFEEQRPDPRWDAFNLEKIKFD